MRAMYTDSSCNFMKCTCTSLRTARVTQHLYICRRFAKQDRVMQTCWRCVCLTINTCLCSCPQHMLQILRLDVCDAITEA